MVYNTSKELLSEIRRIMDVEDIQLKDLATRMGTSSANISAFFKKSNPTLDNLFKVCKALEIDLDCKFILKNNNSENDDQNI